MNPNNEYNSTAPTLGDKQNCLNQVDINGNLKTTLATKLDRVNDAVTVYRKGGTFVNLSASGQILAGPGKILGFYVNSTSGGSFIVSNALTATTPYLGAASIPPAVGWYDYMFELSIGGYVTIATAALDITFAVIAD